MKLPLAASVHPAFSIELLESRIAPAAVFVNATTAKYTDVDGDDVLVKFSKPILTMANVTSVLLTTAASGIGDQLQTIDLTGVAATAQGTSITVTAKHGASGGDGFADVAQISATGIDLGVVTIGGDLGRIVAGSISTAVAVETLNTHSMGRAGTSTGAVDLVSTITGALTSLNVKTDVVGAFIHAGRIGAVNIGGSLLGTSTADSGEIRTVGDLGPVKIGHDVIGQAMRSGLLQSESGSIGDVTIGGSLIAGSDHDSGLIYSTNNLGAVKIGHDVKGNFTSSGTITAGGGTIVSVSIGGSLMGGVADHSGLIYSQGNMGAVKIRGDVSNQDAGATYSGSVYSAAGGIASISIGGSLRGGSGHDSGEIFSSGDLGAVKIVGDVLGGTATNSGQVSSQNGRVASISIGGSLRGGSADHSGVISSNGDMGAVKIHGDVLSGTATNTGLVTSGTGEIASITIGGSVVGGPASSSGSLISAKKMGPVKIGGDLRGINGVDSGAIKAAPGTGLALASVVVGGSIVDGIGINITGDIGPVAIGRDLAGMTGVTATGAIAKLSIGGAVAANASISAGTNLGIAKIGLGMDTSLISVVGTVTSLSVGASVTGTQLLFGESQSMRIGGDLNNGTIKAATGGIGSLQIGGSVLKSAIDATTSIGHLVVNGDVEGDSHIRAVGPINHPANSDIAFGTITIGGRVELTQIRAGTNSANANVNGNAQIGTVKIGGDWVASSLLAGISTGVSGHFADGDDGAFAGGTISKISRIIIGGQVLTLSGTSATFGFGAGEIGSFKANGVSYALKPGAHNDTFGGLGIVGNAVHVGATLGTTVNDGFAVHIYEV